MPWTQPPRAECTKGERWGSALAHGSALVIGLPLMITAFPGQPSFALMPCPVVAYFIGRGFRRRGLAWGAFQGLQASLVHFLIVALAFVSSLGDPWSKPMITAWTAAILLFLYTLWGAWDTAFGYNFRYMFLARLLRRVSDANLRRQEARRRWLDRDRPGPPPSP
jgi:hypothetical protein